MNNQKPCNILLYALLSSTVKMADVHPELTSLKLMEEDGYTLYIVPEGFSWTYKQELVKIIQVVDCVPNRVPLFVFVTDNNEYSFPLNSYFDMNELTVSGPICGEPMPSEPERTLYWHNKLKDYPVESI
jgi:hypothetical protein